MCVCVCVYIPTWFMQKYGACFTVTSLLYILGQKANTNVLGI